MNDNKNFWKGVLTGILTSISVVLLFNCGSLIYSNFIVHKMTDTQKVKKITNLINQYYVNDYTDEDLQEGVYSGIVSSLNDKYSYYMEKETFSDFLDNTNGTYTGIGVVFGIVENKIQVLYVFEGSPADSNGIKVGDIVKKIDGKEVTTDNYSDLVKSIKDEDTKKTRLSIFSITENKEKDIELDKTNIDMPTVSHKMLIDNIGYIRISKFEGVTSDQFTEAFNDLTNQNMNGLIIDLRDNPGGLLNVVGEIANKLVPKGYITYTEDKKGEKKYLYSDENYFGKPLVILVNENSASASEVLSGAVKDLKTGKLVGKKTYGKGVVQTIFNLGDGSGVKLTTAKYYTPSGICIDGIGIEPDYEIDFPQDFDFKTMTDDTDIQLQKGIEVIKGMFGQ